jgi:hypothetical protein
MQKIFNENNKPQTTPRQISGLGRWVRNSAETDTGLGTPLYVFEGSICIGFLLHSAPRWEAFGRDDQPLGTFPSRAAATNAVADTATQSAREIVPLIRRHVSKPRYEQIVAERIRAREVTP